MDRMNLGNVSCLGEEACAHIKTLPMAKDGIIGALGW